MTLTWKTSPLVNPARAGMIRKAALRNMARSGKPRASGDDPSNSVFVSLALA